jgi:hypothetical protein
VNGVTALFYANVALGIFAALDAIRRPSSAWVAADRDKGWWVTGLICFSWFGVVTAPLYALVLLPRLMGHGQGRFGKP